MIGPDSHPFVEFKEQTLSIADCMIFPGGLGDADQFDEDLYQHKRMVQNYVNQGGRYLGICQGSYFASRHYFDLLDGMRAVQHIKTKGASTRRSGPAVVPVQWIDEPQARLTYFHDGASFVPDTKIPASCEVFATYANGDAAAIVQSYGSGKVGAIGPHPEAEKWWFYSQSKIQQHWKNPLQHDALIDFVDMLIK
jgi:glutamine amidotransferase-like uncharacterized protein